MVQKDPQRDNLASEIEDAVDDLFSQYEAVSPKLEGEADKIADLEIDPVPEVKPVAAAPAAPAAPPAPAAPEPIMDLDIAEPPALSMASAPPAAPITDNKNAFETLKEALLTVDWDINKPNVECARKLIHEIKEKYPAITTDIAGQVANMMDKVLVTIVDSPTSAPVSAPGHLKSALKVLETVAIEGNISETSRKALQQVKAGLQSALPHMPDENGVLELDDEPTAPPTPTPTPEPPPVKSMQVDPVVMEADDLLSPSGTDTQQLSETQQFKIDADLSLFSDDTPAAGTTAVPFGLIDIISTYVNVLNQSIQRIIPMENIFAKATGTEKLHAINSKIRELLESQTRIIGTIFSTDFGQAIFPAGRINSINDFIKSQNAVLNLCVKRLKPLEDLFARTAGYEKLFKLNSRIRRSLEAQSAILLRALSGDYATRSQPRATAPVATSGAIPAQLQTILKAQIQELSQCIKTILPLEIFSGPAIEIENLQDLGRQLREKLERQKKALTQALKGNYRSASHMGQSIMPKASPWPTLLKGTWGGKTVAFAPEQVAYEGNKPIPVKTLKSLSYLPLAKLKTGLFCNIKKMVTGELAELEKNVLKELEFPIIAPPETFPISMASLKKATIVIIYSAGQGKALMLDSPLESVTVSEHGVWEPAQDPQSVFSGNLIVFGNSLPVITV